MSLKFHGIEVNENIHPGEAVVKELAGRTLYQVTETLDESQVDMVEWIVSITLRFQLNIEGTHGVTELSPDGSISHKSAPSMGEAPLYVILHDDTFIPPGCSQVDTIELLMS